MPGDARATDGAGPQPTAPRAAPMLQLQRAAGNRAVLHALTSSGTSDPTSGGRPSMLPAAIRRSLERRSGVPLDDVVVHHDSPRPAEWGAQAFAYGDDIHLGPGHGDHLPHEAWHVVQQRQGQVTPTTHVGSIGVNTDPGLERAADAGTGAGTGPGPGTATPVLQGVFDYELQELLAMTPSERVAALSQVSDGCWSRSMEWRRLLLSNGEYEEVVANRSRASATGRRGDDGRRRPQEQFVGDDSDDDAAAPMPDAADVERVMLWTSSRPTAYGLAARITDARQVEVGLLDGTSPRVFAARGAFALSLDASSASGGAQGRLELLVGHSSLRWTFEADLEQVGTSEERTDTLELELAEGEVQAPVRWWRSTEPSDAESELDPANAAAMADDAAISDDQESITGKAQDIEDLLADPELQSTPAVFDSDVDERRERHVVRVGTHKDLAGVGVLVESNPVPLADLVNGTWLSKALPTQTTKALKRLKPKALKALLAFAKQRTKAAGKALHKVLADVADALTNANVTAAVPATVISAPNGTSGPTLEGTKVVADPLSLNGGGNHGSRPSGDSRLMKNIRHVANQEDPPQGKAYKQMHLLNDNVFGPGEIWNLTPGTAASNLRMEQQVETPLKRAILQRGLILKFTATVDYVTDPNGEADEKKVAENPDRYRFKQIKFTASEYEPVGSTLKNIGTSDPDVAAINKTIPWDYGGLRRLRAKARIVKGVTAADLEGSGIPKAYADRIATFMATQKATFHFTGTDKKGQLKDALRTWEQKKGKTGPGYGFGASWNAWSSNNVLW